MSNIIASITLNTIQPLSFSHHSIEGLPLMTNGVDSNGIHQKTVFWPAASLRGRIRHEVAMAAMESSGKVKLSTAYMLALGQNADTTVDDTEADVIYKLKEAKVLREGSPIVDLFGTWKINSRLQVSHLLPAVNVLPETINLIRRDLDANEDLMELLDADEQDAFYSRQCTMSAASKTGDMIKIAVRELMAAKKANDNKLVDEMEAKIDGLKASKKSAQAQGGGDENTTKHLLEVEIIPQGIDLLGSLVIQKAKPRDIEMLVEAFDRISQKPMFGANQARGCGEISGNVTFSNDDGEVLCVVGFGGYKNAKVEWTDIGTAFVEVKKAA